MNSASIRTSLNPVATMAMARSFPPRNDRSGRGDFGGGAESLFDKQCFAQAVASAAAAAVQHHISNIAQHEHQKSSRVDRVDMKTKRRYP